MRTATGICGLPLCAALVACGEPRLECGTSAVIGTVSSMVRARVLRVIEDGYPAQFDTARRARLTQSTRVTPRAMRLVEWDAISGRLTCAARIVVDAPGPAPDTRRRSELEVRYRVTGDDAGTFFVEVGYAEMMSLFSVRPESGR
jgi:hypothetical protein